MGDSRQDSFTAFFRVATGGFTRYDGQLQVAVDGRRETTSSECEPGTLAIGNDQWPFKFAIATLSEHARTLQYQLT